MAGYRARDDGEAEVEAPHGWAEALVPNLGWVAFDAVHKISPSEQYIRLAMGLDYLGAAPIRGSRMGGGTETLDVKLRVEQGRSAVQC